MGKGVGKKKGEGSNTFVLRGSNETYFQNKIVVEFERQNGEGRYVHPSMRDLHRPKLMAPVFNTDRIHYTPTFTLPDEPLDQEYYLNKHTSKAHQYDPITSTEIMIPRPKDKHYCHVCEQKFQDYLTVLSTHITSQSHTSALKEDKFQRRIQKLSRKIMKKQKSKTKQQSQSEVDDSLYQHQSKENHQNTSNHQQIAA